MLSTLVNFYLLFPSLYLISLPFSLSDISLPSFHTFELESFEDREYLISYVQLG